MYAGTADQVALSIGYGTPGVANNLGSTALAAGAGNAAPLTTAYTGYDAVGNVAYARTWGIDTTWFKASSV